METTEFTLLRKYLSGPSKYEALKVSRLTRRKQLAGHSGCVNSINWNSDGTRLVSGSDDRRIIVWSGETYSDQVSVPTGHRSNVFCVTFVPNSNDSSFVTCAADGCVHLLDISTGSRDLLFESEVDGVFCFKHCLDPKSPESVGLVTLSDGSVVRFDLRTKTGTEVLNVSTDSGLVALALTSPFAESPSCTDLAFNPLNSHMLALGTSTQAVIFFDDRRFESSLRRIVPGWRPSRILPPAVSGIDWDRRNRLVVNYCRQGLVEMDLNKTEDAIPREWTGRENSETFLKEVAFYPKHSPKYIVSGGDCGNLFVWERFGKQELVVKVKADPFILNCVKTHPSLPFIASSGIASTVDLWTPL